MTIKLFFSLLAMLASSQVLLDAKNFETKPESAQESIILATKRIYLPAFPGAYNPSLMKTNEGYLMTFRYLPNRSGYPWLSYIGIVRLDKSFEQISPTQLIDTRFSNNSTPSQSEDARIFSYDGNLYLIYNDNMELTYPSLYDRRDMYLCELFEIDGQFYVSEPLKLAQKAKYSNILWQKNWSPFVWKNTLLASYSINPHEVITINLETGLCKQFCCEQQSIRWDFGHIRGGTPALLVDGEYLAFFHSAQYTSSLCSDNKELWHYFMGAYTFSPEPPFEITKISPSPIDSLGFYTYSSYDKRVIYPCGYVVDGQNLYLAYGKDDSEIWIATINVKALKQSMVDVQ